jgi:hypothetical protein
MAKTDRTKLKDSQFWEIINLDVTCCFCGSKIPVTIIGDEINYLKANRIDDNGYLWCSSCWSSSTTIKMRRMRELKETDDRTNEELNKMDKKIMKTKKELIEIQGELF